MMSANALSTGTRTRSLPALWRVARAHRAFIALLLVAALVRLLLAPFAIFPHDPQAYADWGFALPSHFLNFYSANPSADYPPLSIYLFGLLVGAYSLVERLLGGVPATLVTQSHLLIFALKFPPLATDLAAITLIYALARRTLSQGWALAAAASYAFSPYIYGVGAVWGQQDSVFVLPLLLALVFTLRRQAGWAGLMVGLALMLKPQPVVFVPLLLTYLWRWAGVRQVIRFILTSGATGLLLCLPYLIPPHLEVLSFLHNVKLVQRPVPTNGALNLWWILRWPFVIWHFYWHPVIYTSNPLVGPLTGDTLGWLLFGVVLLIVVVGVWRDGAPRTLFFGAGVVALGFYMLTTQQGPRYIFPALALFLLAALYEKRSTNRYVFVYLGVSAMAFANLVIYIINDMYGVHLEAYLTPYYTFLRHNWHYLDLVALIFVLFLVTAIVRYLRDLQTPAPAFAAQWGAGAGADPLQPPTPRSGDGAANDPWNDPWNNTMSPFTAAANSASSTSLTPAQISALSAQLGSRVISVVIPCYNEQDNIRPMYERLTAALRPLTMAYELIFIDNGSYDDSAPVFAALAAADPHVSVLTLSRNFGSQGAYTCGLEYASGACVICIDGDIQDPPELIPALVAKWLEGYHVVYGVRVRRKGSLIRRIGYKAFYRLFRRFSYIDMPVDAGDFGLIDRRVVNVMNSMPERNRFIRGLRAWAGFRQTGIPYVREDRHAGKTTNSILGLFRWASMGLVSFSYAPLELISYLSVLVVGLAAIALVVYMALYFISPNTPRGFQTLLVITLFLGSIQLLSLSIIGAYLGKIFEEIKARPKYIVEHIQNNHREQPAAQPVTQSAPVPRHQWQSSASSAPNPPNTEAR